jgi:hypothetical protein
VKEVFTMVTQSRTAIGLPGAGDRRSPVARTAVYRALREWVVAKGCEAPTILVVKVIHTVVFLSMLACVLHVTWSGIRGNMSHAAKMSATAVSAEALVFLGNGRQCPLTVLVEDLGSDHGQVTDIFLPNIVAKNIFAISTSMLGIGAISYALRQRSRVSS